MKQADEKRESARNAPNTWRPPASDRGFLERVFGITTVAGRIGCMSPLLVPVLLIGYCSHRSSESDRDADAHARAEAAQQAVKDAASNPPPNDSSKVAGLPLADKQRDMVCKAGIAILMGRDPKTMKTTRQPDGLTRVQYRRPDDNKLWKTDCRIEGNRVLWRGVDSFGNDGPGRWRDDPEDEVITFTLDGKVVAMTERFSDGSVVTETYRF